MKSGNNRHPEIIYLPQKQTRYQRNLYQLFTTFAWMTWLYLIQPLISLLVWWLGVDMFTNIVLRTDDANISGTFITFGMVIAGIGIAIVTWSKFCMWRSNRKMRPDNNSLATVEMICEHFQTNCGTLDQMRASKTLVMDINDDQSIRYLSEHVPTRREVAKVSYAATG